MRQRVVLFKSMVVFAGLASCVVADDSALAIFQQRIVPILSAKNPSSCSECHLSGVDLKDYVRPNQADTFAALRDKGLIDVAKPDQSKLLEFIRRHSDRTPAMMKQTRELEYAAFRAWIHAALKDPALADARTADSAIGAKLPDAVIRHMRRDRVLASFVDNVWSEVGRCAACHSPDRNQKQVAKFGEQVSWIALGDPQATLDQLRAAELIDVQSPEKSLLLLKPTNQVKHGGGVKLMVGDRTYKQFRAFLDDYAASVNGRYQTAKELPKPAADVSQVSDIWFKLEGLPKEWDKLLLRVDLYRWNRETKQWSPDRWATGDRAIAGDRQLWQQHLTIVADRESPRAATIRKSPTLPAGRYLAKVYVDRDRRLERDYRAELAAADLVAEVDIDSPWPTGYGRMTIGKFTAR